SLGAPETSFFNMTCNTAGVAHFQWSDTTHNIDGGGMINVGLIGTGNVNQLSIYAPWAARLDFINMKISNIGTLGIFGVTNTKSTQGIFFGHLHGDVATVATPLFQLNQGSGFYLSDAAIFTTSGTVLGRGAITINNGGWDTANVSNSTIEQFDTCLSLAPAATFVINHITFNNSFCYSSLRGIIVALHAVIS